MSNVRALTDCFVGTKAGPRRLNAGDEFDHTDALVQAHPALFTDPAPEPKRPVLSRGKERDA